MSYHLRIRFKSNERPWSTDYVPVNGHQPANDGEARLWAAGMARLLADYDVVLFEGTRHIPFEVPQEDKV